MNNPEQDLIKELMRLTGRGEEESKAFLDKLTHKMTAEAAVEKAAHSDGFSRDDYPRYLPADVVRKYTIRITLKGITPAIWRKVEVPSNISLRHLSELIMAVMGWSGYHMNQFRKGLDTYYEPCYQRDGDMEDFSDVRIRHFNQEEFSIGQILEEKGRSFTFDYDFGDGWEHEVRLSSIAEYTDGEPRKIRFVSGKRACPPEDYGGLWGYDELCGIVRKKASGKRLTRDERERLVWYSGDYDDCFDPELLDLDACADAAEALND